MQKVGRFKNIIKILKPYSTTLIGGSFDPFNQYYFRILKWASEQSRPLIVIVHPDEIVSLRRGFISPSENHYRRAHNIAQLDFVDYVVISKKLAHDSWCLKYLRPKFVIFQPDNPKYLKSLFNLLSTKFSKINFIMVPFKRNFHFPLMKQVSDFPRNKIDSKTLDKIARELILLAKKSESPIGKISALLTYKDKIIAKAYNSPKGDHAEILLLNKIRPKIDFNNYTLYVLIPPCIMCARAIFRSKIKNVYYLYNYGDKLGIEYLKNKDINVKRYKI